jgi:hypothetical protein
MALSFSALFQRKPTAANSWDWKHRLHRIALFDHSKYPMRVLTSGMLQGNAQ